MREAAAASGSQSETVTILDDNEAGAAADNYDDVTEPESDGGEAEPQTSLTEKVTNYVSKETGKKRVHVWLDLEKRMVLQLYHYSNKSLCGTIAYLLSSPKLAGSALGKIDHKMLKLWVLAYKNLQPREFLKMRGRQCVEEFETEVLAECLIADHVAPAGGVQGTHNLTIITSDLHSYAMVQNAAKHMQAMDKWHTHPVVSRLQFKDHWTHSFLLRHGMQH
eukprot:1821274-Rhodomonas_salina.1